MKKKSRIYGVIIAVLGVLLIVSLGLNIILVMRCLNQTSEIKFEGDDSATENDVNFNKELIGTWRYGDDEIIISEDGSYIWTDYSSGDEPYIYECKKGYISDNVMIITDNYSNLISEDGIMENKDTHYYSYKDIPDDEWESGVKTGGYQIIFHGESFGLKTDSNMTNYNFIKQ